MSSFIIKRFNNFEKHLRSNYEDETLKNTTFNNNIRAKADIKPFMVFFLKDLLNHLEDLKRESEPKVSKPVERKMMPGRRTSIPFPKDGLSSIKAGVMPSLDLKVMIEERIENAINDFYNALSIDMSLSQKLINASKTNGEITLDVLNSINSNPVEEVVNTNHSHLKFDIRDYLRELDASFIFYEIRKNIKYIHDNIVSVIYENLKEKYEEKITGDFFSILNGIIPVINRSLIPVFLIDNFYSGNAVELKFPDEDIKDEVYYDLLYNEELIRKLPLCRLYNNVDHCSIIIILEDKDTSKDYMLEVLDDKSININKIIGENINPSDKITIHADILTNASELLSTNDSVKSTKIEKSILLTEKLSAKDKIIYE